MTIAEIRAKCKSTIALVPRDVLLIGTLLTACTSSFGLGYLTGVDSSRNMEEIGIQTASASVLDAAPDISTHSGEVVASKNGTKYYLPECSGASRISPANKISFPSAAAARSAGYTPAANCRGL